MNHDDWEDFKRWWIDSCWVIPIVVLVAYIAWTAVSP
jgi:hypothetical protein